ncbi:flagellar transcriptional activator FlhD [Halomonas ventosae]|uniref:Flagellar transcriptional regulator FlhD n=1 Tax=Halomonas ventosae TaxID=229007 RepID=A0A4R6ZTR6_9GAMM|nr:flagellar transcriptional regulator FlhD [Halomonas ventosae]TDR56140.1 flagellar transcriptional activator FlhD [Halomonas ventosae]
MTADNFLTELRDLNLSYLLFAQRLLHADPELARFRLKLDEEMANMIASLSSRQIHELASTNQLLFRFNVEDSEALRQLVDNPRNQGLGSLHASLLLSGVGK